MLQVLIFSQFKIMMDVLEDSFKLRQYPVERIDGSVSSRDRQAAIDRYSKGTFTVLIWGVLSGGLLMEGASCGRVEAGAAKFELKWWITSRECQLHSS